MKLHWKILFALLIVLLMASAACMLWLGRIVWQLQSENAGLRAQLVENAQSKQSLAAQKLYAALLQGQRATVRSILDANPEMINEATAENRATPLLLVAQNGRTWMTAELIRRGANINATNTFGHTPVHNAINSGSAETLAELLKAKPDLSIRNNAGQTPLQYAIARNRNELAELLRQAGATE